MTGLRIALKPPDESEPTTCRQCGQDTLYVAELINAQDQQVGATLLCTQCSGAHHRDSEEEA
jgi:hypothetical protein